MPMRMAQVTAITADRVTVIMAGQVIMAAAMPQRTTTTATLPHTTAITMGPAFGVLTHTIVALRIIASMVTAGDREGASEIRMTKVAEMSAAFFVPAVLE